MRPIIFLAVALVATPGALATLTAPLQDDAGSGGDAGDTPWTATRLGSGQKSPEGVYKGTLVLVDDTEDWYVFDVHTEGGQLHVGFQGGAGPCTKGASAVTTSVRLYDPSLQLMGEASGSGCGFYVEVGAFAHVTGGWFIQTSVTSGAGVSATASPGTFSDDGSIVSTDYVFGLMCEPWC